MCPKQNQGQPGQVTKILGFRGHIQPALVDRRSQTRGATTQEVNQWHCQTRPLLAWSAAENSSLPRESRNFFKPGDSVTSRSAAAVAGRSGDPSKGQAGCIRKDQERRIPSTAPSVATTPWCPSCLEEIGRCIAVIASARCAPSRHLDSSRL